MEEVDSATAAAACSGRCSDPEFMCSLHFNTNGQMSQTWGCDEEDMDRSLTFLTSRVRVKVKVKVFPRAMITLRTYEIV